ncbi:polyunsaturated fatty acid lipoxygenase ALOX15B [Diretmus argenteus]
MAWPSSIVSLQEFEVTIHTSAAPSSGTFSYLRLNLIGSQGETAPITVNEADQHLLPGSLQSGGPLGRLLLVRLQLEVRPGFPDLDWHCGRVEVRRLTDRQAEEDRQQARPEDPEVEVFPCDRWLQSADGDVELRTGKMCLLASETEETLRKQRIKELQHKQKLIRWRQFVDGAPDCVDITSLNALGPNLSFTHKRPGVNLRYLRGFTMRAASWSSFSELEMFFTHNQNATAKFVQVHWKDDWFFGYQSLNGCNPLLVRRTRLLPPHLSITSDMLRPFLPDGSSLEQELKKGTIYLLDYEMLDGVPANEINGKPAFIAAPLCLLHLNQQGELMPIAIQLQQTPGPQNPVFLPSDPVCDWLLAKMWVHSADFQYHQVVSHYLKTHMLAELCCGATIRQLPEVHPVHQLLMPHVKMSLQINYQARVSLLAPGGAFDKAIACGLKAFPVLLSQASARIQYRSLCVPDDLADRGLDHLPQCYYAQDALRVWDTLHRFVVRWMDLYYHGDEDVQQDSELQHWIREIHSHGFPQVQDSGLPQSLETRAELSQFVTMLVFSSSALHAAVNFSQVDFDSWFPNCPTSMSRPPPQTKGTMTEDELLSFLPDVNSTCTVLTTLRLLGQPATDYVPLCHYQEEVFRHGAPARLVEEVQAELKAISDDITERNRKLELPYPYLSPGRIENSVTI